jgi:hypothetical protein
MLRRFQFEAEIYETLSCVPMAVRRKLDRLGIKIGLEQWQLLGRGERLMICHAPAALSDECEALGLFINEAVLSRSGSAPKVLATNVRQSADPPSEPPIRLMANASAASFALGKREWERLDDDQRYALIKLGDTDKPSHNLKAALLEFLGGPDSVVISDV